MDIGEASPEFKKEHWIRIKDKLHVGRFQGKIIALCLACFDELAQVRVSTS